GPAGRGERGEAAARRDGAEGPAHEDRARDEGDPHRGGREMSKESKETVRAVAAEVLGTLVLLAFGAAVGAQVVLSGQTHGGYLSINIGWGLAVIMAIYVSAGASGAHLNPAVTLALAWHRGFAWSKVLPYWAAQLAGAFAGAAVTFLTYRQA